MNLLVYWLYSRNIWTLFKDQSHNHCFTYDHVCYILKEETNQSEICSCKPCNKSFNTTNAYDNHMQSKKHKEVVSGKNRKPSKKSSAKAKRQTFTKSQPSSLTATKTEEVVEDDGDEAMSEDENGIFITLYSFIFSYFSFAFFLLPLLVLIFLFLFFLHFSCFLDFFFFVLFFFPRFQCQS